jgi:hypothetical protein
MILKIFPATGKINFLIDKEAKKLLEEAGRDINDCPFRHN